MPKQLVLLFLIVVSLYSGLIGISRWMRRGAAEAPLGVGQEIPFFEVFSTNSAKDEEVLLRGRRSLLIFFSWRCSYCREEIQTIDRLLDTGELNNLRIVAIPESGPDELHAYSPLVNNRVSWLADSDSALRRRFRVHSLPTLFLVNELDRICKVVVGLENGVVLRERLLNFNRGVECPDIHTPTGSRSISDLKFGDGKKSASACERCEAP